MIAQVRKVRFISADSASHASRSFAQHVRIEQRVKIELAVTDHRGDIAEPPDRQRIFIGDKPQRPGAGALKPPRQQHAERLVRQPALKGIADEIMLWLARGKFSTTISRTPGTRDRCACNDSHSRTWSGSALQARLSASSFLTRSAR